MTPDEIEELERLLARSECLFADMVRHAPLADQEVMEDLEEMAKGFERIKRIVADLKRRPTLRVVK